MSYEYPSGLTDYLTEMESEGYEIITTHVEDGTLWIIDLREKLEDWLVLVQWYEGDKDFNAININSKGYHRLLKVFNDKE
jgi:hypothetical protein